MILYIITTHILLIKNYLSLITKLFLFLIIFELNLVCII